MGYMDRGSLKGSIHADTTRLWLMWRQSWRQGESGRISGKVCIVSILNGNNAYVYFQTFIVVEEVFGICNQF